VEEKLLDKTCMSFELILVPFVLKLNKTKIIELNNDLHNHLRTASHNKLYNVMDEKLNDLLIDYRLAYLQILI
jgi:hypothetical protein